MAARPKEVARARAESESSTQGSDEDDGDDGDSDVGMRDAEGVGDVAAGCAAGMDDGAAGPRPQRAGKEDVDPSAGTRGLPSAAAVARGAAPPRVERVEYRPRLVAQVQLVRHPRPLWQSAVHP